MKKEFYDIYERLYARYSRENEFRQRRTYRRDEYSYIETIRNSIDTVDKENALRPDAKYFLIVNFHYLIVRPLFEPGFRLEKELKDDIQADIQADIATIVSETKKETGQEEISGHQIMQTIDKVWKDLKTTRFELWG